MARPKPYLTVGKKRVPSVTTITGRFKDSGGLIWWANAVGLGERDCDDQDPCQHCGRRPGRNHTEAMNKAADVGTLAHAMIENRVKGVEYDDAEFAHLTEEQFSKAADCLSAFDRWLDGSNVEIIETEMRLVSEKHLFGGTFDAVARVNGRLAPLDWKTTKGLYADHVSQVAGYGILIDELGVWGEVEQYDILRVSKETAAFHHHSWPASTFEAARQHFLNARTLYDDVKGLEKLLK